MYFREDAWMLRRIFQLSDKALIRMVNHLFRTEYSDQEDVWKEWHEQGSMSVWLRIGGTNRYEFRLRRLEGCIQICAEDRGCVFCYENAALSSVVQIREPQVLYFGKGRQEEYSATLEFPGKERVMLPVRLVTLEGWSARKLEEGGLIPFLPFLFYCFGEAGEDSEERQAALKDFLFHDIAGALGVSYQKGDLTAFDVQRLKQLCRQMAWKVLGPEKWMQDLEVQELILDALEVDLDHLEHVCRKADGQASAFMEKE